MIYLTILWVDQYLSFLAIIGQNILWKRDKKIENEPLLGQRAEGKGQKLVLRIKQERLSEGSRLKFSERREHN